MFGLSYRAVLTATTLSGAKLGESHLALVARLVKAMLAWAVGVRGLQRSGRCLQLLPSTSWARDGEMERCRNARLGTGLAQAQPP